jgi:N-acyl-D-amino-acid deacylase
MTSLRHKAGWLLSSRSRTLTILSIFALSLTLIGGWYFWRREQQPTCSGTFDLVVLGAEIIDGLGGPPVKADIGLRDQRIACIGTINPVNAKKVIDANGLAVAPGFIDVHTHVERNVPTNAPFLAPSFLRQGVTTVITGNCGRSFLDIGQLFKLLEINGADINVASFIGHNTVRLQVMHESAAVPGPEQLAKMKALIRGGMRAGALGLSTGLEYIPGTFAKTDEIVELAKVVRGNGGVYVSHLRDEGPKGEAAIREAISIGERAGVQVHISHFKVQGPNQWGSAQQRLDLVKSAAARGLRIAVDQYPYTASSTGLVVLLPSWLSEGGIRAASLKLSDPTTRRRVRDEMIEQLRALGWTDYSFARIAYCESDRSLVGLTIPEITQRRGDAHLAQTPVIYEQTTFGAAQGTRPSDNRSELEREADTVIDLYSHGGAQMVFFNMNEGDVETIMREPEVMFGSDSGVRDENASVLPHPRGSGTFPRILGVYAREKHLFSIEEAVRRMTSLPAATFGLKNRGRISPGYWADLVIFDRNRILDTATYDKPLSIPVGIDYVIVNGSIVLDQGVLTQSAPGMALRHNAVPHE